MWKKPNANLIGDTRCSTSAQFADQGGESTENGTDNGISKPRNNANHEENSVECGRDCFNSQRDLREFLADHIGNLD